MSKDAPAQPETPNPYSTAAAQTGSNVNTAIANSWLGNANEVSPLGSVSYTQTGSHQVKEPQRDKNGQAITTKTWVADPNSGTSPSDPTYKTWQGESGSEYSGGGGGQFVDSRTGQAWQDTGSGGHWQDTPAYDTWDVPTFTRETKYSPETQGLLNSQQALAQKLLNIGNDSATNISSILSTPLNFSDLPTVATPHLTGDSYASDRAKYEDAEFSRINPQLEQDRNSLENTLVNQGFQRGTEAFNQAMDQFGRQSNDARMQAVLAGGQEQSRLASLAQQQYALESSARQNAIQERLTQRQTPINEILALMSGSQVQLPQFSGFNPAQVANTPVGDYVYKTADLDAKNYATSTSASNAASQGLFGLGSSLIGGLAKAGPLGLFAL